ncbi:MAG: PIN domain-containing protein [Betaproteobacteria bacterium]|nr:PIN domain-containing protein [Betaproteobacteria bacterium]MBA3777213.1 PIN domain-containing protein [Betaproteobacteria bacterium]
MTPFFDTNVVLYLLSADPAKAERAEELIAEGGLISIQVLNEVTAVTRRKLGMSWREVRDVLAQLRAACAVAPLTVETHERGLLVAERCRLSVYDGMIVAAALLAGCSILYTEARQDGQVIDGQLTLRNPFA